MVSQTLLQALRVAVKNKLKKRFLSQQEENGRVNSVFESRQIDKIRCQIFYLANIFNDYLYLSSIFYKFRKSFKCQIFFGNVKSWVVKTRNNFVCVHVR